MKDKLYDNKRSSLELSDSSPDERGYRKEGGYGNYGHDYESYNSPNQLYSPDLNSLESSAKPKSILKDNLSASKGKNIIINERLNETHKLAQSSESNNTSPPQVNHLSDNKSSMYGGSSKDDKFRSGGSGVSDNVDNSPSPDKLGSKYNQDYHGGFKNRLIVGNANQGITDFQKAHVRKLQQEREQELSSKALRESADQVRERWLLEKAKRSYEDSNRENSKVGGFSFSKGVEEKYDNLLKQEESERDKSYRYKLNTAESKITDPGTKFHQIEDKIYNLEKDLNAYSKNLKQNVSLQEEKNQSRNKVYEDFEDKMQDLKEELNQSLSAQKNANRGYQGGSASKEFNESLRGKSAESKERTRKTKMGNNTSNSKIAKQKSASRLGSEKKKGVNSAFKTMQGELARLQEQNEMLRDKLEEQELKDTGSFKNTKKPVDGPDIDREKELIETIERIKKKLRRAINKKTQTEKNKIISEVREEAATQSFGREYSKYGFGNSLPVKSKIYDNTVGNKENYKTHYKGTKTYSGSNFSDKKRKTKN